METKTIKEKLFNSGEITAVKTGISPIDDQIKGFCKGELTTIIGASGIGKSLFLENILVNMAKSGEKVVYYDLENGPATTYKRLLRLWHGLDNDFFLNKENESKIDDLLPEMSKNLKVVFDQDLLVYGGSKYEGLVADIMKCFNGEDDPFLIGIDPLQALETKNNAGELYNEQGKITEVLKNMTINLNTSIVLLHHLRKTDSTTGTFFTIDNFDDTAESVRKYRIPQEEDLKGSQKIFDFSVNVMGIARAKAEETKEKRGKAVINLMKLRNQRDGKLAYMYFDEDTLIFKEPKNRYSNNPADIFNGGL